MGLADPCTAQIPQLAYFVTSVTVVTLQAAEVAAGIKIKEKHCITLVGLSSPKRGSFECTGIDLASPCTMPVASASRAEDEFK